MLGIYEKALPPNTTWDEKLKIAKELNFDFVEMSIDESDEKLKRLQWTKEDLEEIHQSIRKNEIPILSMCLSGHRRFPLGSIDLDIQNKALKIMEQAIKIASYLGIRNIQLAGYDVYYDEKSTLTQEYFTENLQKCVEMAADHCVMLSIETMDDSFINSIRKIQHLKKMISSPWLQAYPDIGNINAWPENNLGNELENGIQNITQIHLKDTLNVRTDFPGKFKNVDFGTGDVDFIGALKILKRLNYHGAYMIEMWNEDAIDPINNIKKARKFIDGSFKKAGVKY